MNIRDVLAANLKRLRRTKGVSQEELAHRADIDRTYISMVERRRNAASIDVLAALAAGLGVEPADLLKPTPPAEDLNKKGRRIKSR
ncbi:helix-turn-helix domain-containing protein [Bradyrhizobium sp. USDA 4353]